MIITCDGNIPSTFAHTFNVVKMAQGFSGIGEDVTLLTLLSWPNISNMFALGNVYRHYGISSQVKIKYLPVFNKDFFYKSIHAKDYNKRAAQWISKRKPNFVYGRSFLTPYHTVQANIPTIVETHTTDFEQEPVKKLYEIANHPAFLGVVTIHDDIKKEHVRRGIPADKIQVLADGVDLEMFNVNDDRFYWRRLYNLPLEKKIVMYCGSLHEEKGIRDILMTAQKLGEQQHIYFVLVGGNGPDQKKWQLFSEQLKLENVLFTGFVPNTKVPGYLKSADVLIMPYGSLRQYEVMDIHTTSPLKLYEYMASGRPIVSTNIPVISAVVQDKTQALLAPIDNYAALAENILTLLAQTDFAKQIANNAYTRVQQFQWTERCKKIKNYFIK